MGAICNGIPHVTKPLPHSAISPTEVSRLKPLRPSMGLNARDTRVAGERLSMAVAGLGRPDPIHSAEALALKRTARPPGKPISVAQPQPHSGLAGSLTSWNPRATAAGGDLAGRRPAAPASSEVRLKSLRLVPPSKNPSAPRCGGVCEWAEPLRALGDYGV